MFVKINGTDISEYVQESTYFVDSSDVTYDWEDGFYKKHKEVLRTKITGAFDLVFLTLEKFNAFKSLVESSKDADGCVPVSIMVTNTNQIVDIDAYVTYVTKQHSDVSESTVVYRYSVNVEER